MDFFFPEITAISSDSVTLLYADDVFFIFELIQMQSIENVSLPATNSSFSPGSPSV